MCHEIHVDFFLQPELGNLPPDGLAVLGVGDAQPQQGDLAQPDEGAA